MKFLIASDIHGSAYYAKMVVEKFIKERADKLILLGDIFNHGPRNPLPKEYAPLVVAEVLNGVKENLIVVKGNCDSQVDTMISEFDFIEQVVVCSGGKIVLCTHGHIFNKDAMPKTKVDALIYGHFHTGFIKRKDGVVLANAGSTSLPKNGTKNSYMVLEDGKLTLKDFEENIIEEIKI